MINGSRIVIVIAYNLSIEYLRKIQIKSAEILCSEQCSKEIKWFTINVSNQNIQSKTRVNSQAFKCTTLDQSG